MYFGSAGGIFARNRAVSAASIVASVIAAARRPHRRVHRESRIQIQQVAFDLLRDRRHRRLQVDLQQVRHRQHFRDVRKLEGRFRVRVQHDLRVPQSRVLQLYRARAVHDVVRRHRGGIGTLIVSPALRQRRFVIAIHQVPHHQVPHQHRQCVRRHQFHDRGCDVS